MITFDGATTSALSQTAIAPRQFITFFARNRTTNAIVQDSYWSDVGTVSAEVIDPITSTPVTRTFYSGGGLIGLSPITSVVGLTVQTITIDLSQVSSQINDLIRLYDVRQTRVEIFSGLLNPSTHRLVAPAFPTFVGYVDTVEITTPSEGETGSASLSCVSQIQEMTRKNSATCSDSDQKLRNATDNFFRHASTVGSWQITWGSNGV